MVLLRNIRDFAQEGCVLALGTFDGVHRGHKTLLLRTVELARQARLPAAALTFDRHPLALLCPEKAPRLLTTPEQKRVLIERLGIDVMIEQPFTREWATQSPECFLEAICRTLHPRALVVGVNYTFARGAMGNVDTLRRLGPEMGFTLEVIPPILWAGEMVSSTRIRRLLSAGCQAEAEQMAGHALTAFSGRSDSSETGGEKRP